MFSARHNWPHAQTYPATNDEHDTNEMSETLIPSKMRIKWENETEYCMRCARTLLNTFSRQSPVASRLTHILRSFSVKWHCFDCVASWVQAKAIMCAALVACVDIDKRLQCAQLECISCTQSIYSIVSLARHPVQPPCAQPAMARAGGRIHLSNVVTNKLTINED